MTVCARLFGLLGTSLDPNLDSKVLVRETYSRRSIVRRAKSTLATSYCIACTNRRSRIHFMLDEPENHLHPAAAVELLRNLYNFTAHSQIWIATHSVPLLAFIASVEPMALWFVEDGVVKNAGRHPKNVLLTLLGSDEGIRILHSFTGLPAQLAALTFACESLTPPSVATADGGDPQVSEIHDVLRGLAPSRALRVLRFWRR